MINGETTVTYTPIKGRSMYNISTYGADTSATGSTMPAGSSQPTTTSILWTYPGGITNKPHGSSGLWGYLLSPQSQGEQITTDEELTVYLKRENLVAEDGTILNMDNLVNVINNLVSSYFVRVLKIEETSENLGVYGLQAFKNNFEGCYRING